MIELWGRKNAYNVQKVLWTLAELQLDYEHYDVGSNPDDLETVEFLALNPHARIPLLSYERQTIWESNTITRFLTALHSPGNLWPDSAFDRSCAERWMDWELSKLQNDFIDLFWGFYRTPEALRDLKIIDQSKDKCEAHLQQLELQLTSSLYLAGDLFTMADITCGSFLYRYQNMGMDLPLPHQVRQWYLRLTQREAFNQVVMVPFDELKGRSDF